MKRKPNVMLVLCLIIVFLSACSLNTISGAETPGSTRKKPSTKPFEGQSITALFMSGSYANVAREIVPEFEAATGATVEVVDFPYATLREKMLLDFTSGTASYDVIDIACQWDGEMAPFLEPLDPYIIRDNFDIEDFDQNILDNAGRWEGVIYGIPNANTPYVMAYRTDLVSEDELPTTWEEYIAIAEKHYDPAKGMYGIAPTAAKAQYGGPFYMRIWSLGSEWADENWNVTLNTKETKKALEISKRVIELSDPGCLSWGINEATAAFVAGNAVFLETWATLGLCLIGDDPAQSKIVGKWALAPFPSDKVDVNLLSAWDISINKNSTKKDLSWEFIKAYTSAVTQLMAFEKYSVLPPRLSVWEIDAVKNSNMYSCKEALADSLIWWRISASEEARNEISNAINSYFAGEIDVEKAMNYMQRGVTRALKSNPPPDGLKNVTAQTIAERMK